ncbi:MAG: 30S ribosomal protein S5 [Candidatus Riflebacteria bacterium]|nr:30S ribosomal protein S5 [Candidatus Riflebacteria bacterium]
MGRTGGGPLGSQYFSFSVLGVVGDGKGRVGVGLGKANLVPDAVRKSLEAAKKHMVEIPITKKGTIPFTVRGHYGSGCVVMKPAAPGTGVIAGGCVRAVMEAAGIRDILTKSLGNTNPANLLRAAMNGLLSLKKPGEIAKVRGLTLKQLFEGVGSQG